MISVYEAHRQAEEAARKAARQNLKPFFFWPAAFLENAEKQLGKIPFLGTYLPKDFERVRLTPEFDPQRHGIYEGDNNGFGAYFVDTGFGGRGEPPLTIEEFLERIRFDVAYGLVEAGEFQVKIGVFRKKN
jgi:hypothetical protein